MSKDRTGMTFNMLTAIERIPRYNKNNQTAYRCVCECGTEKIILSVNLITGKTKSCGCYRRKNMRERSTKHGLRNDPIYNVWVHMKDRCYNKNHKHYDYYGGRGILMCSEWLNSPEKFIKWSKVNGYKKELQVDRIDNNLGYSPNNCRYVTPKKNSWNKRNNRMIKYNGETKCLAEWADLFSIKYCTLYCRINKHKWPIEKALTTPVISTARVSIKGA